MPKVPSRQSFHRLPERTDELSPDLKLAVRKATGTLYTTDEHESSSYTLPHTPAPLAAFTRPLPDPSNERSQTGPLDQPARHTTTTLPARRTTGLLDVATTQSLVAALQASQEQGQQSGRPLVIIPGDKKRTTRLLPTTEPLPGATPRRMAQLKHGIVLAATLFAVLFVLLTFTPLASGLNGIPGVGNVVQLVQGPQGSLNTILAHFIPPTPTPVPTQASVVSNMPLARSQYVAIAEQDATNVGIPPDAFVRQIQQESSFNPDAVSPAGAVGIAQFLPSTAYGLGFDPYDPIAALNGAAHYMANLGARYGGDYAKALAAYNAGPATVQNAVNEGGANWLAYMPLETQNYVRIIMGM